MKTRKRFIKGKTEGDGKWSEKQNEEEPVK